MSNAYIYEALRTPRGKGKKSGALYEVKPIKLLATVLNALRDRLDLDCSAIDDVLIGCVTPIEGQGANIAKAALLYAGWPDTVPGLQLNRFGASGLEVVNLAAMKAQSTWEELIVAGGVESMSRINMNTDGGPLRQDPEVVNLIQYIPQGIAADLIATRESYTREMLDNYALLSHERALFASRQGYFDRSLIPVFDNSGLPILTQDECIRPESSLEKLAGLPASFENLGALGFEAIALRRYPEIEYLRYMHTAGNSSDKADGAAVVLVGTKRRGEELGLTPRAKIRAVATASTEPTIMFKGAVPAARKALDKAGMAIKDIELWEVNEAFAAPVLQFQRELDLPIDILNVNGGAIALGHPLGATGAMLIGTLLDELERRQLDTGLVSFATAGGMGVATIIERI